jgi:hypothetical protein
LAAFQDLDWQHIDVQAIVGSAGLATIDEQRHHSCQSWLRRQGYAIDSLDFTDGLAAAVTRLGNIVQWEEQFGYALRSDSRNLDALNDGFSFLEASPDGGRVLELIRPDLAWQEDSRWLLGLLSIAQEHSRRELALGRRFFTLLVVPDKASAVIGQVIDQSKVPGISNSNFRDQ